MAKLYFYYSAMNAGKTTTLLQSAHNYRERGMRVAILTPRLDHRAGSGVVASRIGLQAEATAFDHDTDLQQLVERDMAAHGRLGCVLVDEAQFLTKAQVWQLSEVVDQLRIPVLCYGLRTDFRGELFEGSQGQPVPAGLGRRDAGDQDHLPQRQEGDDDRARGRERLRRAGRPAGGDRRQRPLRIGQPR